MTNHSGTTGPSENSDIPSQSGREGGRSRDEKRPWPAAKHLCRW